MSQYSIYVCHTSITIYERTNFSPLKMNTIFIILLVCSYFADVIYAFLNNPSVRFTNPHSSVATYNAGEPLFLTPFIDADRIDEARNLSRVAPPLLDNVESFSGYLTVNRTTKSHLFFWFIPKTKADYTTSPLILWLQGGPGVSSLFGLFTGNGPFKVDRKGKLHQRRHAWTEHYHMLYIDQPVGTGFSFAEDENGYIHNQKGVGEHLLEVLVQFYKLFPHLKKHDFYIAGESYGGKYVPAFGYKIHTANRQPNSPDIPLRGMMIGNGCSDPENMVYYAEYLYGLNFIDRNDLIKLQKTQEELKYLIQSKQWSLGYDVYDKLFNDMSSLLNSTNLYDINSDIVDLNAVYVRFVTQDRIRKSIHVGGVRYDFNSDLVGEQFKEDFLDTVRPWIEELLEYYPMLFYNGQSDIVCAHPNTENFLRNLHWSGASKYGLAKRQIWREGDVAAGFFKTAGNLVDVLVRNAGHMVPTDQPKNTLSLIDLFIKKNFEDVLQDSVH